MLLLPPLLPFLLPLGFSSANRILLLHEWHELSDLNLVSVFESTLPSDVSVQPLLVDHSTDEGDDKDFCQELDRDGQEFAAVVDLSWGNGREEAKKRQPRSDNVLWPSTGWEVARRRCLESGIPYIFVSSSSNAPFVRATDEFLYARDAVDAAFLFEKETELEQSLYQIVGNFHLRLLASAES